MSKTIDERVVEMRFDNKQFESNVATSMSTLEKLKRSLKLDGAAKGIESIDSAAKKVDMSGLGGAVETVKAKFSALDVVAVTALANITNSAVNAGKRLVSSLTIDQVTAGWQKFADKTTSVATLVAQGNAIEDVNAQLDRLNWFTDETSYNFTEMVSNIAKFTATGKGLNESVTAMEGIATWAALSGQNAATASRAMYQLSQAMGAGVMRKEDYKSIQNASMDTDEFRQKCLDAGVALGTLQQVSEDTYASLVNNQGEFNKSQFAEHLTQDLWLTSDVMMKVFNDYSAAVEGIYNAAEEKGMLASEVIDEIYTTASEKGISTDEAIKSLGYSFDSFALKAFEAAQKARTFNDAIDSVKDAVSTSWMNTFEHLFGNAEQATKLWTDVANQLYDIFASGGERRNEILDMTMTSKWDTLIEKIEAAGGSAEDFESKLKETAREHGIAIDDLVKEYGSLSAVISAGKLSKSVIVETIKKLAGTFTKTSEAVKVTTDSLEHFQGVVNKVIHGDFGNGAERIEKLTQAGENAAAIQELVNKVWERSGHTFSDTTITTEDLTAVIGELSVEQLESVGYTEEQATALKELAKEAEQTGTDIYELIENLNRPSGQELLFGIIHNSLESISTLIGTFKDAWADIFPSERVASALYNALSAIQQVTERILVNIQNNAEKLKSTFKGVIAVVDILASIVGGALKAGFQILGEIIGTANLDILGMTGSVGDVIVAFRNWVFENDLITKGFDKLVAGASKVIGTVKHWIKAFANIPAIRRALNKVTDAFNNFVDSADDMDGTMSKVKEWFNTFKQSESVQKILTGLGNAFKWCSDVVEKAIVNFGEWLEILKETEGVKQLVDAVESLVSAIGKLFSGEINAGEFASALGSALANLLISLPKIAIQLGKDFIAGFANGLGDGISGVIGSILEFCSNFISAFAEALGIHSPSWISYQNAVDWWQGFINGCEAMLGPIMEAIQPIIDFIKNVLSSFWDYITDESGNIEWGKIIAGGITIETLVILKQFADTLQQFANAATAFAGIGTAVKNVFTQLANAITRYSKAMEWDLKTTAIMKMAIAIGILAGSIWVLCQIDDPAKLWQAVGVIAVLALIVYALAAAVGQLGGAAVSFDAASKKFNMSGLKTALLQIGIALLMLTAVVKIIGSMDANQINRGLSALAGMAVGLIVFMAAVGGISAYAKDVKGIGTMMMRLSLAMVLMVGVCKLAGNLSAEEMLKGAAFAAAFAIFVNSILRVAKSAGNNVGKVGGMIIGVAFAMTLMVGVCKLVGLLSVADMLKGVAFGAAFVLFVRSLVQVTKIGKRQQLAKINGLVLSISVSLLLMVGVCKLVGTLSVDDMLKGVAFTAAFVLLIRAMVNILKIGTGVQIAKVGATILAMSTAIMLMAGTAVILGMVDLADLVKGVAAVAILGSIVALMAHGLKGAADAKATMMAMAATVAIMAGSIVALSMIKDTKALWTAVGAMTALMGMFSVMIYSLKAMSGASIKVGPLIALTGVIVILAGVIATLTQLITDVPAAIAGASAIAGLLVVMTGVLAVLSVISLTLPAALIGIFSLAALGLVLRECVWVLASMSEIDNALSNVLALSALFAAMAGMLAAVAAIGGLIIASGGTGLLAILAGLGTLAVVALGIKGGVALFKGIAADLTVTMDELAKASENASRINVHAFDGVPELLSIISQIGTTSLTTGIKDVFTLGGTTMDKFQRDGKAFFEAMKEIVKVASEVKIDETTGDNIDYVLTIATKLSDFQNSLTGIEGFMGWLRGVQGLDTFGENAKTFFTAISTAMSSIGDNTYKKANIEYVITTANKLGVLQGSLTGIEGFMGWLRGVQGLDTFGENAKTFFTAMSESMSAESVSNAKYNEEGITYIIDTAQRLGDLQNSLEGVQGFADWLNRMYGDGNLASFGENAKMFFTAMSTAMSSVTDATYKKVNVEYIITTANKLAILQNSLTGVETFMQWLDSVSNNLGTFGLNASLFFNAMSTAMTSVSDATYKKMNIEYVITTANKLAILQSSIQGVEDFINWLDKMSSNLGTFGTNASLFFTAMSTAMTSVSEDSYKKMNVEYIIVTANKLAILQNNISGVENFMNWLSKVSNNLGTFGSNASLFFNAMSTAMSSESVVNATYNKESIDNILTVAGRLSEFQNSLTGVETFMQWLSRNQTNLGTFGVNAKLFLDAMSKAMSSESIASATYNADNINAIIAFGGKLSELQKNLPDEHWFDGKLNLGDFSKHIGKFAEAMSDFSAKASGLDIAAMDVAITAARKIRIMAQSLSDFDDKGLQVFTGIGTGGFGADGVAYKIAKAMSAFSDEVTNINIPAVETSVSAAIKLKTLINNLANLNTDGIEKFKPDQIGTAMATYSSKVSGLDVGKVASSVNSAIKLKTLINDLAGLNTSGVSSFKSAVEELGTINVSAVVKAFSGVTSKMFSIGADMMSSLGRGMISGSSAIMQTVSSLMAPMATIIRSKGASFMEAGKTLMTNLSRGMNNGKSSVSSAVVDCLSGATSKFASYWSVFYSAGSFLVSGFSSGITANTFKAVAAASAMAEAAIEAAREKLRINSPSKVFRDIGSGVPEGFALGIGMLGGEVTGAVNDMASSAINTTRSAMSTVLDVLNGNIDAQPTIRPVVDLSDVQTGVNAISGLFDNAQTIGVQSNLNAIGTSINAMHQNGKNDDVITAINRLRDKLDGVGNTYNTVNGITYDDGSNVTDAVETLVRYAKIGRRV